MGQRSQVFTVHDPNGGWTTKVNGLPVSHHERKVEEVKAGRELARALHAEHVIGDLKGRIRDKNSYGPDPFPPRDKR